MNDLASLGEALAYHLVVALMLVSLPESYDTLVTASESRQEADSILEMVKGKLISDYRRKNESEKNCKESSEGQTLKVGKWIFEKKTCYGCGKAGHFKYQCRNFKKEEYREHEKTKQVAEGFGKSMNVSEEYYEEETESKNYCFMVLHKIEDVWCINSGATSHMTNNMNFFTKFNSNYSEVVTLADGTPGRSQGI